ncbi:hypothetical protein EUX98_g2419 [Antrodiella citrinella]|uniref:CCL2-like lectin domain-containing protein n=1 Tax=Antrodiella citrinella TaxID=2447956 RepID=A0A4V3XJ55_9APHY|nr:hypothetical protein EUX98_g2419 [Antrodiella citrinella]
MSRPAPGRYVIYNRVLSPSGQKLAMSYKNGDSGATVTALNYAPYQVWEVQNYDSRTQSISPQGTNLQCAWGDGFISVLPAGGYVWVIIGNDDGYTIQDGGESNSWGVDSAVDSHLVNIGQPTGSVQQRWIFEKM